MADSSISSGSGLRYVIIGAGMAGILAAVRLKEMGETNVTIFEKGNAVGGTWRDNRYPGLTCDTPSHCYTYSFAPHSEWQANFASGREIRAYFEKVAADFGILDSIQLNTEVTSCQFDEVRMVWHVGLAGGEQRQADVIIAASGVLHHPNIPHFAGIETFKGKAFHSARWDDDAVVDGSRVGVIGCGSTGVQIVSALSSRSAKVTHFQRSPQWILPAEYLTYSDEARQAFRDDPSLIDAVRNSPEYWNLIRNFTAAITNAEGPEIAFIEDACLENLENSILDPVLREKLRPDYRAACKRLVISWSYYDAVQRPSVAVETNGIERIEPDGVRTKDGTLHPLDVLVLATGFKADRFIRPTTVTGRNALSLDDFWQDRPTAHYAVTLPGFPNFFMLNGPTGPVGNFPLIDIAEKQWNYISKFLDVLRKREARTVEPTTKAHADYDARRIKAAKTTIFGSGCASWYLDSTGVPSSWPWSYDAFDEAMRAPDFTEYQFA